MVDDILGPLLRADGSDIQLVAIEEGRVTLALEGEAAFGSGAHYVRTHVVEPAIREAAGEAVEVVYEKRVPKVYTREGPLNASSELPPEPAPKPLVAADDELDEDADTLETALPDDA